MSSMNPPSPFLPSKLLIRLATLASLALLCITATYWVITLSTPRRNSEGAASASTPVAASDAATLFGAANTSNEQELHVSGVMSIGQGAALVSVGGAPERAFTPGARLDEHTILRAIRPSSIVVERDGVQRDVALSRAPSAVAGTMAAPGLPGAAGAPSTVVYMR